MTSKTRLLISAVVCCLAIAGALYVATSRLLLTPEGNIEVKALDSEDGRDWLVRLYHTDTERHWQKQGNGYQVEIERQGVRDYALQLALTGVGNTVTHQSRQTVRLSPGVTLVAAFAERDPDEGTTRIMVELK